MNRDEAMTLLESELALVRAVPYEELVSRISNGSLTCDRVGPSGVTYQVEIQVVWDDRRGGNIRVMGSIDDGGWRAVVPLTLDFLKAPDNSFVGD